MLLFYDDTPISEFIYRPLALKSRELLVAVKEERVEKAHVRVLTMKRKLSEETFKKMSKV
jgi:hypothetical protein